MRAKAPKNILRVLLLAALMLVLAPLAAQAGPNDDNIKNDVNRALNPYGGLSVSVNNGRVTLSGPVPTSDLKDQAVRSTRAVPGVISVKDEMRIADPYSSQSVSEFMDDSAVTAKVMAALVAQTGLNALDIGVQTNNGVVMLTGQVDNKAQIALAGIAAQGVKGVKSVDNRLSLKR